MPANDAAVGITAPSLRIEEFGIMRARQIVEAVAREVSLHLQG